MSYATLQQLIDRYGQDVIVQVTDRATPPAGAIDQDVVDRALADTAALIDGYLAGRYQLPLATTPSLVIDLALQIAIYKLHRFAPDEKIKADYDAAMKMLRELAQGIVRLDVAGIEPESAGKNDVLVESPDRMFDSDTEVMT
jgi:phage gp36-like protein